MPLPKTPVPIHFIDRDQNLRSDVAVRTRESGYKPTTEYFPTMQLVRCKMCMTVGVCEFANGFNLKDGDRIMSGKVITGLCLRCNKQTELVPVPTSEAKQRELRLYYQVQESLKEAVRRGERLSPNGMVWPLERIKEWERWKNGQSSGQ